jgi:hypothetical protein
MNIYPTGSNVMNAVIIWCAALAAIGAGFAVIWRIFRGVRRMLQKVDQFIDDWNGVSSSPGHPERPGVMVRLERIEHELVPNSGHSLRDAVDRLEHRLDPADSNSLPSRLDRIEVQVNNLQSPSVVIRP